MSHAGGAGVALLPWGDVIEDFLDTINLDWEDFRTRMTGGWMFGYVEALQSAGVRTAIVCVSRDISVPERSVHEPTGATLWRVPAGRAWRVVHHLGAENGRLRRDLAPYLATPLRHLERVLRAEGCSAILCQEYEYARFDACVLLGRRLRIPVFATFQGGNWQASWLERPIRPWSLRACRGVIVASERERQRLRARYNLRPSQIARIFNPLDLSSWVAGDRGQARAELRIPPGARVVIWHGRIDIHRKGLDVLVDAWERVCAARPGADLRLLLVGTGEDAALLARQIADRGLPGVDWLNKYVLDRAAMRRRLSAADVYTLPSRHEGLPVAPLEAMACELPVVAADAPGVADILHHGEESGGVIVPCGDAGALASALVTLLDDLPRARRLGQRARARVEACVAPAVVGQQLRTLLLGHGARAADSFPASEA